MAAAVAVVLMAVLSAPAAPGGGTGRDDGGSGLRAYYRQQLSWGGCPASGGAVGGAWPLKVACATVQVPLDYAQPDRGTLTLAVDRVPATGPGPRLGSLLINFGGPGISGTATLTDETAADLARLNTRYDLVGFDPRGVSRSTPVDCGDLSGVTAADAVGQARQISRACHAVSGTLLPYVGTTNAARDLDVIRQAVGDDKLAYLGFSYGSKLGAVYAHEFPDRTGRMVLDGVPDPTLDEADTALAQTAAFQKALTDFAADCAAHPGSCPVPGHDATHVLAGISAGVREFDGRALTTSLGQLDRSGYLQGLQNALYSKDSWPDLRQALADLRRGDGELMMQLAYPGDPGQAPGRIPAPADWAGAPRDNYEMAKFAIDCQDTPERPSAAGLHTLDAKFTAASPLFGSAIEATLLSCTGWPPGDGASRHVAAPGAPFALLVSTTGDPATPYAGARRMAAALGNGSRVLTYRGEGHGAYFAHNACVNATVDAYLLDGTVPPGDTTC